MVGGTVRKAFHDAARHGNNSLKALHCKEIILIECANDFFPDNMAFSISLWGKWTPPFFSFFLFFNFASAYPQYCTHLP